MANYDDIYKNVYDSMEDQYNEDVTTLNNAKQGEQDALDAQKQSQMDALNAQKAASDETLLNTRNEALRQAYISRMQNQRDMPGLMAAQGLSGGPSETALASIMRGYQNSRNTANKQYSQDQTTLDTDYTGNTANVDSTYAGNVATLGSKYAQLLLDLQTQRRNNALEEASLKYQAAVQQEQIAAQQAAAAAASTPTVTTQGSSPGKSTDDTIIHESAPYNTKTTNNYAWQNSGSYPKSNSYVESGGAQRTNQNYSGRNRVKVNGKWVYI